MTCRTDQVVKKSPQWEIVRHKDGDTADIIETILYADSKSGGFILPGVQCLEGSSEYKTLGNVWSFVKSNLRYRADRPGYEKIKSPGALFATGFGDCKSFSVAIGAILSELGIPYRYRFAAYDKGEFTHVYVVADGVQGDVILDAVHKKFDDEVPYYHYRDIRPAKSPAAVNGIGAVSINAGGLLIGGLLGWLVCKMA